MSILIGEANNSYYNVPVTGGSGSGATFNVSRDGIGDILDINVVTGGYDYNEGETLTIDGSYIGGSSGTDDIIFIINGVVGSTGTNNNFFGNYAGRYNITGSCNNFFGSDTGYCNTTGSNNNFFGNSAGFNNTTGGFNNFLGPNAGRGRTGRITFVGITTFTRLVGEANNTYSNVSGTGGSGSGATFNVSRDSSGDVSVITTAIEGQNYNVGNTLTIDGGGVGGSSGTDNITITIDGVQGSTGSCNNFFGCNAGYNNTTGNSNNFFGTLAGYNNTTGVGNNFFGILAGRDNISGKYNNFFGRFVGLNNTTGCNNNFFGTLAGYNNTTGCYNNFFGTRAGFCNTTGCYNNFFGICAGRCNTFGNNNIFLGSYSGISTSASRKVIIGSGNAFNQLFDSPDTTKGNQFAVGIRTDANPSKYWLVGNENFNVGIGITNPQTKLHLDGIISFTDSFNYTNVRIGDFETGYESLTFGNTENVFIGPGAGKSTTNGQNVFIGTYPGYNNTIGFSNIFIGEFTGYGNISGSNNIFMGFNSGTDNTNGIRNTFLGWNSGSVNTTGNDNTSIGGRSAHGNTTGVRNIFLGSFTGISTSASQKVILGSGTDGNYFDSPNTTKNIQFAIGVRTDANPSKYWLVGNENFNVGIGTTSPTSKLTVTGDVLVSGVVTASNGFTSGIGVTNPVQITVSGSILTFTVVGVGSTSLTLY